MQGYSPQRLYSVKAKWGVVSDVTDAGEGRSSSGHCQKKLVKGSYY